MTSIESQIETSAVDGDQQEGVAKTSLDTIAVRNTGRMRVDCVVVAKELGYRAVVVGGIRKRACGLWCDTLTVTARLMS